MEIGRRDFLKGAVVASAGAMLADGLSFGMTTNAPLSKEAGAIMKLANGRTLIEIDQKTGSIIRIVDAKTGLVHINAVQDGFNDARLFRLISPVKGWHSRYADSHASGVPKIERNDSGITISYPQLCLPTAPAPIAAVVTIDMPAGSDEVRFTLKITNNSDGDITDVLFPWLGGWRSMGGKGKDLMVAGGQTTIDPNTFPLNKGMTYGRVHQRQFFHHAYMYAPWYDVSGPQGGLSSINYTQIPRAYGVSAENMAGHGRGLRLGTGWAHYTWIKPGETWTSQTIGISVHGGDWHETADRYIRWAQTWYKPAPTPAWAQTAIGFQNIMFRSFDGSPIRDFGLLPEAARIGRKYDVPYTCVWDYMTLGNYSEIDDFDLLDYSPKDRELLRKNIKQAVAEGSKVSALINFQLANPMSSVYRKTGEQEACRRYDGSTRYTEYCMSQTGPAFTPFHIGPSCFLLDARVQSYRDRVKRQMREYFDLGYTDVFHDHSFQFCPSYIPGLGQPDSSHTATVSLLRELTGIVREINPNGMNIGENGEIFNSQHIDLWMQWFTDTETARRGTYTLPITMRSWLVDDNIVTTTQAVAMGMQLCLMPCGGEGTMDDRPEVSQQVGRLAKFRQQCASHLCHGRFRDNRGIEVKADSGIEVYSFDSPDGPAVAAVSSEKKGKATIKIDRTAFNASTNKTPVLHRLNGESKTLAASDKLKVELGPTDIAMWII